MIKSIFFAILLILMFFQPSIAMKKPSLTNSLGMQFVYIEPGVFKMGSPDTEIFRKKNEKLHTVRITNGFYISISEVTQEQFYKVMKFNPSSFNKCGGNCPVERVSWNQAQSFIKKLNQIENTDKYRLPTEAEWEYSCRAGTSTAYYSGDLNKKVYCDIYEILSSIAWYCGNSGQQNPPSNLKSHPVMQKKPNNWGLYDMHGNVAEWVLDSCRWKSWTGLIEVDTDTYVDNIADPLSKVGDRKIFRGGSWSHGAGYLRSASRSYYRAKAYRNNIGFRIVKMR